MIMIKQRKEEKDAHFRGWNQQILPEKLLKLLIDYENSQLSHRLIN